ncbi:DNA-processing protein DprA [Rhodocyclaceae bacterium SMB388]
MSDLADWIRLTRSQGLGPAVQRTLLAAFGLPEGIFSAGRSALVSVVGAEAADRVLAPADQAAIEEALTWSEDPDNHIVTLADGTYPQSLLTIPDPPVVLYVRGNPARLAEPGLSVVGARSATAQGVANAEAFSRSLAEAGLAIVSGLALGIDAAAHRGALAADRTTIAVIGTGADRVYPARNRALAHQIAAHGAIVSEYPLGTPPLPHNFPRRNRIIAGLGLGVLVVEAAVGSGSLITARLAADCGREVFAIPGSIHSPLARGCHRLIRDGAKLVETASDVFEELGWSGVTGERTPIATRSVHTARTVPAQASLAPPPDDDQTRRVIDALGHDPTDLDTLASRSGLTLDALYAILLPLELDGHISRMPGGRFQRL